MFYFLTFILIYVKLNSLRNMLHFHISSSSSSSSPMSRDDIATGIQAGDTFQCINGMAPGYLSADLRHVADVSGRKHLCSAASSSLGIPATWHFTTGDRSFVVAAASVCNKLPLEIRSDVDWKLIFSTAFNSCNLIEAFILETSITIMSCNMAPGQWHHPAVSSTPCFETLSHSPASADCVLSLPTTPAPHPSTDNSNDGCQQKTVNTNLYI